MATTQRVVIRGGRNRNRIAKAGKSGTDAC